ncbi:hypothetical protein ACQU0X_30950 [Pseudovibrio ascidiaceicola]|uniref:hypothetical protein n=1 Tax=Pseudovibrio ascidiaceicola TaxID=285279 RepID=UPI003D36E194
MPKNINGFGSYGEELHMAAIYKAMWTIVGRSFAVDTLQNLTEEFSRYLPRSPQKTISFRKSSALGKSDEMLVGIFSDKFNSSKKDVREDRLNVDLFNPLILKRWYTKDMGYLAPKFTSSRGVIKFTQQIARRFNDEVK